MKPNTPRASTHCSEYTFGGIGLLSCAGKCPVCGFDRMMMQYDHPWLQFDACPKCGFGHGIEWGHSLLVNEQLWKRIPEVIVLDLDGWELAPATRKSCLKWVMALANLGPAEKRAVFVYSMEDIVQSAVALGVISLDVAFTVMNVQ